MPREGDVADFFSLVNSHLSGSCAPEFAFRIVQENNGMVSVLSRAPQSNMNPGIRASSLSAILRCASDGASSPWLPPRLRRPRLARTRLTNKQDGQGILIVRDTSLRIGRCLLTVASATPSSAPPRAHTSHEQAGRSGHPHCPRYFVAHRTVPPHRGFRHAFVGPASRASSREQAGRPDLRHP